MKNPVKITAIAASIIGFLAAIGWILAKKYEEKSKSKTEVIDSAKLAADATLREAIENDQGATVPACDLPVLRIGSTGPQVAELHTELISRFTLLFPSWASKMISEVKRSASKAAAKFPLDTEEKVTFMRLLMHCGADAKKPESIVFSQETMAALKTGYNKTRITPCELTELQKGRGVQ